MKAIINYEHAGFVFPDTRLFNCTAGPRENPGASAVIALRLIPDVKQAKPARLEPLRAGLVVVLSSYPTRSSS